MIRFCIATTLLLALGMNSFAQGFSDNEYKKALWMTTRMYGGQRSGDGPNWLIMDHTPTVNSGLQSKGYIASAMRPGKCFTEDADGTYSLSGGWVDCGDHVKFGQTMFYAAYMLSIGYSEFPQGYDDYYTWNYEGYQSSGDFTWEGAKGIPNGIPDILDELKYQTDFFIKCARNSTTFYSQVGDGGPDHLNWVTSVAMAALPKNQGGQNDGSRNFVKNPNDCVMPALCAATLASMSRLYKKFDPEYAALCLQHAEYAYDYAESKKGNTVGADGGFYPPNSDWEDDFAIMYAEMYRATGNNSYKAEALTYSSLIRNHNWTICYNNCDDLAAYLLAKLGSSEAKLLLDEMVAMYQGNSSNYVYQTGPAWGVLRYVAGQAFVTGLKDKLDGTTSLNPYADGTIGYIMGDNSRNLSFIVGFGANHADRPHHRNYYLVDDIMADKNSVPVPTRNEQFGFLVGGAKDPSQYHDVTSDYESTEGGIDYNAGLVSALGYINSIVAPVDTNKFGHPTPILPESINICGSSSVLIELQEPVPNGVDVSWYNVQNDISTLINGSQGARSIEVTAAGIYMCVFDSVGEWSTSSSIEITGEIPEINLGGDVLLCSPAYTILDAGVEGAGISYVWKINNFTLENNRRTLAVYAPGTYSVEIQALGCTSKSASVVVESRLPLVSHDTICTAGSVNLSLSGGDGVYQWYASPDAETPIYEGNSYNVTISESVTYYVGDASSINIMVGPNIASNGLTGGQNAGNVGVYFDAHVGFEISQMTVIPKIYDSNPVQVTFELSQNGVAIGTYTSETVANGGDENPHTITFSTPIIISSPGTYKLTPAGGNQIVWYDGGANFQDFSEAGVITFTGDTREEKANSFLGIFDIQIQTGSQCDRFPVFAVVDPTSNECSGIELEQLISLEEGWNFISLNVEPSSLLISIVFSEALGDINCIKTSEGFFMPSYPEYLNSITAIDLSKSYLVECKRPTQIRVVGYEVSNVTTMLNEGWNYVAYPVREQTSPDSYFGEIWDSFGIVKDFGSYYTKGGNLNTLTLMQPGFGYFVELNSNTSFTLK